jgi:leucine dehydrogenase
MSTLAEMVGSGHEQVAYWHDRAVGLRAIIAIHSTALGPALGGCRMHPYVDEHDALRDVLRLSRGMTLKCAVAGVPLGGGKSVVLGDPDRDKSEELFRSFGRFVDTLGGRYTASVDVGTGQRDLDWMRLESAHVTLDLSGPEGDGNYLTALGTFAGIRAAAAHAFGSDSLAGRTVAVQGLGQVGWELCRLLHGAGAALVVADVREARVARAVEELGARAVAPEAILAERCDVLAPCALGGVLHERSIPALDCRVVAGCANNVLVTPRDGRRLHERGIVYAPDYVINAGGIITEACRQAGLTFSEARERVLAVHDNVARVLAMAHRDDIASSEAADRLAAERLGEAPCPR